MRLILILAPLLLLLLASPALAGGKKGDEVNIAFHMETQAGENPKMVFPQFVAGEERQFRRIPEVSTKDIKAFNPFPSRDGEGYGVLLTLKSGSNNRLAAVTASNTGKWMISRVNGRIVDAVRVDQQINDGELVIWKGISAAEIEQFEEKFSRISTESEE